ncbi:MAG: DUF2934 domain-containing protein [Candidatus Omnitrophota bacterium]|nr:DUF2934 domain-containing protein [Candidatus Omnitrophota bacterium]MDZ4242661.1 DUF2934 domain-containing protein [Candidatus Omnitrophota bacterium]
MSKHRHQRQAERISGKSRGAAPLDYEKTPDQANELLRGPGEIRTMAAVDDSSIQLRAYQIYLEKGGSALDNWLEAERILMGHSQATADFINEGNPNAQEPGNGKKFFKRSSGEGF